MRRLALILPLLLLGCAASVWYGDRAATLTLGMSKKRVQELLGPPQGIMTQQLQGGMIETWRYIDRSVIFQNGILQSWTLGAGSPLP